VVVDHVGDIARAQAALLREERADRAGRLMPGLRHAVDLDAVTRGDQQRLRHRQLSREELERSDQLFLAKRELLADRHRSRAPRDPDDEDLAQATIRRIR
jgi:hypothetical protein